MLGYKGIGPETGTFINKEDAFRYAIERILAAPQEEKAEFEEWFYSGNYVEVHDED